MSEFEEEVRSELERLTGYACEKQYEVGHSGNIWKVDCVLLDENDLRKAYLEVKETSASANQSTYINHMRRAYAEMGDFRKMDIPKGVVVAEKWDFGRIDWDAMLDSIDCSLVEINQLDKFIERVDSL